MRGSSARTRGRTTSKERKERKSGVGAAEK